MTNRLLALGIEFRVIAKYGIRKAHASIDCGLYPGAFGNCQRLKITKINVKTKKSFMKSDLNLIEQSKAGW